MRFALEPGFLQQKGIKSIRVSLALTEMGGIPKPMVSVLARAYFFSTSTSDEGRGWLSLPYFWEALVLIMSLLHPVSIDCVESPETSTL